MKVFKYVLVGGLSALVNYCVTKYLFVDIHWSIEISSGIGFFFSWTVAYMLNYYVTFNSTLSHRKSLLRNGVVSCIGLFINVSIMTIAIEALGFGFFVSFLLMSVVVFANNYILNSRWSF